jgi:putative thioredoxin
MNELSYDVTEADFRETVLERSLDVPVLLDCWAPWCGPCRSLKPLLEKLVQAYGGRFELAKLNTDEAPQIAAALQVRSIPLVVLFIGGQPVDQFMGALPESQIRAFLDQHLPPPDAEPEPELTVLDEVELLIANGAHDEAHALLENTPTVDRDDRHRALQARLALARNRPPGDAAELAALIAANPKDFEARFALAAIHAWAGEFGAAFEELLDVILRDKGEQRERARKQLVEWFEVCPDPDAVSRGRRFLGMYLN